MAGRFTESATTQATSIESNAGTMTCHLPRGVINNVWSDGSEYTSYLHVMLLMCLHSRTLTLCFQVARNLPGNRGIHVGLPKACISSNGGLWNFVDGHCNMGHSGPLHNLERRSLVRTVWVQWPGVREPESIKRCCDGYYMVLHGLACGHWPQMARSPSIHHRPNQA